MKNLGGLFVLGTERHEARRIDNQLRGRSGRQGDPGETRFYVSLEDSLMRIFASDTIKKMMGSFGIPEDEPIENGLISRALESAQQKIEGFHFDSRKHVLEFDTVLDHQRKVVYERRRKVLLGNESQVEEVLQEFAERDEEKRAEIDKKREALGTESFLALARRVILQTMDLFWVEHLESMEYLRGSVNLRAYGQRDPLVEYRKEGLRLFKEMEFGAAAQSLELILKVSTEPGARVFELQSPAASPAPRNAIGRNETVTITDGTETKQMKYKKAEALLGSGTWKIV